MQRPRGRSKLGMLEEWKEGQCSYSSVGEGKGKIGGLEAERAATVCMDDSMTCSPCSCALLWHQGQS